MDDVVVVKAAHDVDDGVGFADVGEELVAQAFAFARARNQAGDVDELDDGGLHFCGLTIFANFRHARVGYFDDADVGFDGAEGIVRRFGCPIGLAR